MSKHLPFTICGVANGNNAYTVKMGHVWLCFSYETLIGVHVWDSNENDDPYVGAYRRENTWSSTTAKHFRTAGFDKNTPIRTEHELYEIVRGALFTDVVHAPLNQGEKL